MKKVNILKIARIVGMVLCVKAAVFMLLSTGSYLSVPSWLLAGLSALWFISGVLVLQLSRYINNRTNQSSFEYAIRFRRKKAKEIVEGEEQPVPTG